MTVQYDGTEFAGFQSQPARRTVQDTLEAVLLKVTGEMSRVAGAGRTDAGVHATGQVISFQTRSALDPETLKRAANAELPEDVLIPAASVARPGFHARLSATSRTYRYAIWNEPHRVAIGRHYVYPWRAHLDTRAMDQAARTLVGRHDFAAFAGASSSSNQSASTVRTLYRLHCWRQDQRVFVEASADAFLTHMVRNLVGTLILVGMHQRTADDVREILDGRDRRRAGRTAPAVGLCLTGVQYW